MKSKKNSKNQKVIVRAVLLGLFAVIAIVLILNRDLISDRILAVGYQPTAEVESIIKDLQLTDLGERILFASRPELQSSEDFNENCPIDADTATLGCYHLQRIYVYDVQNSKPEFKSKITQQKKAFEKANKDAYFDLIDKLKLTITNKDPLGLEKIKNEIEKKKKGIN